uniref:Uncharacterized protein n=2 Tax=Oryza sativa subsp. japonica TaxID=39947 RepID=Q8W3D8_ORYSJ|nr:hypothetical protein [Oryza sativa Japonica Group]AAP54437.1 hypothetical protein LOC_Os10g35360 [Oryza sativa Japonica Group]
MSVLSFTFLLSPPSLPSLSFSPLSSSTSFPAPAAGAFSNPIPARARAQVEQQVVTHGAVGDALHVGAARGHGGLDFFVSRSHAARLIDLVTSLSSARVVTSKQLVSHVKLCLVCRDDLIFLPSAHCCNQAKKVAGQAVAE